MDARQTAGDLGCHFLYGILDHFGDLLVDETVFVLDSVGQQLLDVLVVCRECLADFVRGLFGGAGDNALDCGLEGLFAGLAGSRDGGALGVVDGLLDGLIGREGSQSLRHLLDRLAYVLGRSVRCERGRKVIFRRVVRLDGVDGIAEGLQVCVRDLSVFEGLNTRFESFEALDGRLHRAELGLDVCDLAGRQFVDPVVDLVDVVVVVLTTDTCQHCSC